METIERESDTATRAMSNGDPAAEVAGDGSGVAFCEGRYVPAAEAKISVHDWGFARNDTTYDVVHVWKGRFFRLEDHLDRFERSCGIMRLDPGLDRAEIREVLMECVRRSGLRDAYVKLACTRGQPTPGSRDPRTCRNTFFAFAVPFIWIFSPERQEKGIHLIISSIPRIPPESVDPTAKNFHWGDLNRGLREAHEQGGDTVALSDLDGNVSEGPGFNVFRVQDGRVTTPEGTVLGGITRRTVEDLCRELGIGFEYGAVTADSLREADEAFLSSTAGGVIPVTRIDDRILSNGAPGPLTTRVRDLYWRKHDEGWHGTQVDY